jgi:beta-phosphoglucomutase-like phosphatase (HAD superfamily)
MRSTDPQLLRQHVEGVKAVLFDFDGPLCPLFKEVPAHRIAEKMKRRLGRKWRRGPLGRYTDTHALLRDAEKAGIGRRRLAKMEAVLTKGEVRAAALAPLTEGARDLIEQLHGEGMPMAVTTNNSVVAVEAFLRKENLEDCFVDRIFGRDSRQPMSKMKPDPSCLDRALVALGLESENDRGNCLMIGDSRNDVEAAREARVRFLGFVPRFTEEGRRERKERELRDARAVLLVHAMEQVIEGFRAAGLLKPEASRQAPLGE